MTPTNHPRLIFKRRKVPSTELKRPTPIRRPRAILSYGPDALLLQWEQRIDPAVNAGVHAYAAELRGWPEVVECVPAYASLLVRFASPRTTGYRLRERIYDTEPSAGRPAGARPHELPVWYAGPDLTEAAAMLAITPERLVELHTEREYLVYQLGYLPGFAFLGETDPALEIARRAAPRARVPAGAVGMAGRQTGVYPTAAPGGWQLIGLCPLPLLRDDDDFARLRAGDRVRFRAIHETTYRNLQCTPTPWPER